jgi:anti-sigma regulatory factor (Ser/Thr protein kinase)
MGNVAQLPMRRDFRAHPSALYQMRQFIREQATDADLTDSLVDDLVLAVSEACVNAVVHSDTSSVRVSWRTLADQVEVTIEDDGVFERKVPIPELDGTAGRGIPLMLALVDEVTIREGTPRRPGTLVRFRKQTSLPLNEAVV